MARILDANLIYAGAEPKFGTELTKLDLMRALNWYNQNKASKDSEKYACDYIKKKFKIDASEQVKKRASTFGWVCRILTNGGSLSIKDQIWFDGVIGEILNENKESKNLPKTDKVKDNSNVVSIQERVAEKVSEIAGDLEGSIDDYILTGFDKMPSPYGLIHTKAKGMHANKLVEIFKKRRAEFDEVLTTKDAQLKEGYSNFSKPEIKKLVAYCDLIITDCMKLAGEAVKSRKPRKRKVKSPEELVAKMKYQDKFDELKLVSVQPKDVIGAMQLWVYNTKQRRLGCYQAEDAGGFSVKGSTILNFSESKSIQKRLRKPEQIVPEVLKGGKVFLRNVLSGINTVDVPLTGRINEETILLRIIK
jgi:hypothetical protein